MNLHFKKSLLVWSAAPVKQNHLSKHEELMLQKTTHLRISAPRSPNVSDGDAFCTVPAMRNACLQSLFKRLALPWFWNCCKTPTLGSLLTRCRIHCACRAKPHPDLKNCSKTISFYHFWLPNVFLAKATCTFSTSQLPKVLRAWGALYVLTSKCASCQQPLAFCQQLTCQKCSKPGCLSILAWTCTLSTGHLPKVLRTCGAF